MRLPASAATSQAPAEQVKKEEVLPDWDRLGNVPAPAEETPLAQRLTDPYMNALNAPRVRLDMGAATSVGKVRDLNEDSYLLQQVSWCNQDERRDLGIAVVADGLGGHEAGERASHLVIRTLGSALAPILSGALSGLVRAETPRSLARALADALREANRAVFARANSEPSCRGMGATVATVIVWDGEAVIGHLGDCRVYHFRAGAMAQVTRDQTLVNRMVELGQLTEEQALTHPARYEVVQAIGGYPDIEPASYPLRLQCGDWLIAACDGLHAHVELADLEKIVAGAAPSAATVADQLVDLANERGGSDNCTVVAIRCY
jgi:protein phosphatase